MRLERKPIVKSKMYKLTVKNVYLPFTSIIPSTGKISSCEFVILLLINNFILGELGVNVVVLLTGVMGFA